MKSTRPNEETIGLRHYIEEERRNDMRNGLGKLDIGRVGMVDSEVGMPDASVDQITCKMQLHMLGKIVYVLQG